MFSAYENFLFYSSVSEVETNSTRGVKSARSSPSRSPPACRFNTRTSRAGWAGVSEGERRVSEGWAARSSRARSPSIDRSQNRLPSLRYFGLPSCATASSSRPCGSDRQADTQGRGRPFRHARSLINYACFPASSPSISLFQRPHSPPSWRNEKPRLRSCKLEPNATAIREGPTERKTALETTGSTTIRLRQIKIRC